MCFGAGERFLFFRLEPERRQRHDGVGRKVRHMSEFERIKHTIGNRTILMTSWFDDTKQTWRAGAPAYSHLSNLMTEAHGTYTSRKAAIDKLSYLLESHFSTQEDAGKK